MMFWTAQILLIIIILASIDGKLNWELSTQPIVFGKEINLTCFNPDAPCVGSRRWFGGRDNKFLCSEDRSSDPNKYELMLINGGVKFAMMIKQINLNDVNCKYACFCGFEQATKTLLLIKGSEYVYPPNMGSIDDNSGFNEGIFLVNVTLNGVYPVPLCTVKCDLGTLNKNDNGSVVEVKILKMFNESKAIYTINLFHRYNATCKGQIVLTCNLKGNSYQIANWTTNMSDGGFADQYSSGNTLLLVVIVFAGIIFLCVLTVCCGLYRRNASQKRRQNQRGAGSDICESVFCSEKLVTSGKHQAETVMVRHTNYTKKSIPDHHRVIQLHEQLLEDEHNEIAEIKGNAHDPENPSTENNTENQKKSNEIESLSGDSDENELENGWNDDNKLFNGQKDENELHKGRNDEK